MADASLYNTFVQNVGRTRPLTEITGQVVDIVQEQRAARLRAAQESTYRQALQAHMENPTPESLNALYEAASPIGKFDQIQQQIGAVDSARRQGKVEENMSVLAPLMSGSHDVALEAAKQKLQGYQNSGQDGMARHWGRVVQAMENGDYNTAQTILSIETGLLGEEGKQAMQSVYDLREDRRDDLRLDSELYETINNYDFSSEAERNRVAAIARDLDLPSGMMEKFVQMASVRSMAGGAGGLDTESILDIEEGLRKEYISYIEPVRSAARSADAMRAVVESGKNDGFSDQAVISLFNLVLDPGSTVRQSEVANTEAARALIDRIRTIAPKAVEGQQLTPDERRALLDVAELVEQSSLQEEAQMRDTLTNTLEFVWGEDQSNLDRSVDRVFFQTSRDETETNMSALPEGMSLQSLQSQMRTLVPKDGLFGFYDLENMTAAEIREELPEQYVQAVSTLQDRGGGMLPTQRAAAQASSITPAQEQEFRQFIVEANPGINSLQDIANVPLQDLIMRFRNGWNAVSSRW